MLTINDNSLLTKFEQAEIEDPSPTKPIDETRTIYGSRKLDLPQEGNLWGQPVLCDFGEARIGQPHKGLIQPEQYRAPEVLFDMEWGSSVDIWSVAALVSLLSINVRAVLFLNHIFLHLTHPSSLHRYGIYSKAVIYSTALRTKLKSHHQNHTILPR